MPRRASLLAGAVILITGCGSGHSASAPATRSEHAVALPGLGRIVVRCTSRDEVSGGFDASAATATERVTVEGDGGRHLAAATMNPGDPMLSAPAARYATMTWRVIQSTEPRTLVSTVHLVFSGQTPCAQPVQRVSTRTIGHQGKWSSPSEWP